MNYQEILAVGDGQAAAGWLPGLQEALGAAGFTFESVPAQDAAAHLKRAVQAGAEPVVLLIDAGAGNPLALARELRAAWPSGHMVFLCAPEALAGLRKELGRAPLIGPHWSVATPGPELAALVADAARNTQRRLKLRTTLDRANARLGVHKPVDGVEFRRLQRSERYLESFLAQTSDAIVSLDETGAVLYSNPSAARLFALDAGAMAGMRASQLPCWSARMQHYLDRIFLGEPVLSAEFDCQFGGKEVPVEVVFSAVSDEAGKYIGTTLIVRDISARRRQMEQERREQEERHQAVDRERARVLDMFDKAPGFMAILQGPRHIFERANQAYYALVGERSLIGRSVSEAFPDLAEQGFAQLLDQVYATGEPWFGQAVPVSLERRPGIVEELYIDVVYQPFVDEEGRVTGIFCQGSDVTARKQAQDALLAQQAQLENLVQERTQALHTTEVALHQSQKLEAIGKLTGGVAHDFNNILQVIGGNLEMLQADAQDNPLALSRLQKAIASVDRGAKLASQLLSFARRQPLQPVATNLGRILRDMDDLLRRALGESVHVETIVSGGLWMTMVDRNQLENVILNLAINARDAMNAQGRLTLELGNAVLDDAYVQSVTDVPAGQYVMLAVSDTGSGMTPETMERAFEPFFTTKKEGEGTGLGLSMVYGFVKQSGGHIRIYSEPGHGTTFRIYLPRVHLPEAVVDDVRRTPASGGTETILVVEDDLALQGTVVEMLGGLGYRTLRARDGESALTVLQSGVHIDLLFTDVVMPGSLPSPELARMAKEILPDIEVLFTSGYTQNAIVHGGRLDPGVELISKPYRRDDLARKIGHLLANRRHAARLAQERAAAAPSGDRRATDARRILVVEDNADAREMLCELLGMLGHSAQGAPSAEAALQAMDGLDFDVLLTDIGLPGMSGTDLARQLKRDRPELRVVFASGYGAPEGLDFEAAVLPKPYDLAQLEQALAGLD